MERVTEREHEERDDREGRPADERWPAQERRKKRSSFVERIGRARARRASDPKPEGEDEKAG
jgi:hypothetical protein